MLTKSFIGTTGLVAVAALAVALLAMRATTPLTLGPLGVTAWFLLVEAGLSALAAFLSYVAALKLQPKAKTRRRITEATRRGLLLGTYATSLLALSSLQQLNLRDVGLLALLLALVEFYSVARS